MEATISAQDVITFTQDKDASGAKGAIANLMKQKIMVALEGKKKTYDKALLTVSPKLFNSIVSNLTIDYKNQIEAMIFFEKCFFHWLISI